MLDIYFLLDIGKDWFLESSCLLWYTKPWEFLFVIENASLYDEYNEDIEVSNRKFHDLVASWMELYFSKVSNAPAFGILHISSHKYHLPTDSLLHLSHILWVFSNSSMHGIMILSQMVSWLHWKYDYTWLGCFLRLEVGVNSRISSLYEHVDSFQYAGLWQYFVISEVCVQSLRKLQRLNKDSIAQWIFCRVIDRFNWVGRRHWSTGSWNLTRRISSRSRSQML